MTHLIREYYDKLSEHASTEVLFYVHRACDVMRISLEALDADDTLHRLSEML